jgi:hypothetical protein
MTSPVEISIHVVSPVSIANGQRMFLVDYKVIPFVLKNCTKKIKNNNTIIKLIFFD